MDAITRVDELNTGRTRVSSLREHPRMLAEDGYQEEELQFIEPKYAWSWDAAGLIFMPLFLLLIPSVLKRAFWFKTNPCYPWQTNQGERLHQSSFSLSKPRLSTCIMSCLRIPGGRASSGEVACLPTHGTSNQDSFIVLCTKRERGRSERSNESSNKPGSRTFRFGVSLKWHLNAAFK